ncbi:MAG TPA: ABC transporter permease [Vicinamibacterales bacterium]|nr:ABC transporter permease [Vicinamibacterales bacterium]
MKRAAWSLLLLIACAALAAPWLSPNPPNRRFDDLLYAPPTDIHIWQDGPTAPFIYSQRVVSRIERRFESDTSRPVTLRWFSAGTIVTADPDDNVPLFLLGADGYGRDVFSRLLHGARATLAVSLISALLATIIGASVGGIAGYLGGWFDGVLSRVSEFVLVLPAIYVALVLRAVLPLVLPPATVFMLLVGIFALLGWPIVARGVRAIVLAEREREYAVAARAAGAGDGRVLLRHLLPASTGFLKTQASLLVPAFMLAEATLSYVGLGFPSTVPTWGTMLQDASNVALLGDAPWSLAPAVGIFVVVLGVNLLAQSEGRAPVQLEP